MALRDKPNDAPIQRTMEEPTAESFKLRYARIMAPKRSAIAALLRRVAPFLLTFVAVSALLQAVCVYGLSYYHHYAGRLLSLLILVGVHFVLGLIATAVFGGVTVLRRKTKETERRRIFTLVGGALLAVCVWLPPHTRFRRVW